jgi:hypothetical protein
VCTSESKGVSRFVAVGPSCGVKVRVEDGVALELPFQVWSRPGRSDLQRVQTSQNRFTFRHRLILIIWCR